MICEICLLNDKNCLEYNKPIEASLDLCAKDSYNKSKISPNQLALLLEEYDRRINLLENVIGRPNLKL